MSKKFWVRGQNAHRESIWTSSNDRIPRIRTLRDRISRGMTVYYIQFYTRFFIYLQVNSIPGIEEVNMIKDDGTVIHFNNPKVQASLAANTFAVTGHGENKQITDLLPGILNQLGAESLTHLKKLASNVPSTDGLDGGMEAGKDDDDDDVPDLVENFDEASKNETTVENVTDAVEKVEITEEGT